MVIHLCVANSNAAEFSSEIIAYVSAVIFFMKIICTGKYSMKQLIFMSVLLIVSILSFMKCRDMRFLWFVLAVCAAKDVDFDKTVEYSAKTVMICCICFILLYFTGFIEGANTNSIRGTRMSFGLGHPNMCSAYYALIVVYMIYLKFSKFKIKHIVLISTGALVVYYFTKSNTGFIITLFSIGVFIVLKYIPLKKINIKVITKILLFVIVTFTLLPIIYDDSMLWLDNILTGRIHQAHFYFQKYGISLLGNDVSYDLNKWNTDNILDLGYARMLIYNGVFYYFTVVSGYIICLLDAWKKQQRNLVILLGTMIVYMATENVATYIFMNASMIYFSNIIFNEKERKVTKKYESKNT